MNKNRLDSSWLATLMLVLIAWVAGGFGSQPVATPNIELDLTEEATQTTAQYVLAGKKIIIDPGHGGQNKVLGDFGTEGVGPNPEKDNVLQVALHLQAMLEQSGAQVVMTRTTDVNPATGTQYESLPEGQLLARVALAEAEGGDAFVSIHNDWHPDPSISGSTTYYYHGHSEKLALALQDALVSELGTINRGVARRGFKVIRDVPIPSALVEVGYLSNASEAHALADPTVQRQTAEALHAGLVQYFTVG